MSFVVIEVGELLTGVNALGFRHLAVGRMVLCHLKIFNTSNNDKY